MYKLKLIEGKAYPPLQYEVLKLNNLHIDSNNVRIPHIQEKCEIFPLVVSSMHKMFHQYILQFFLIKTIFLSFR